MKGLLATLKKKSFIRNVAIVMSGTAVAQIISMLFSPVITRIYGPEAYGVFGTFMSMVAIISPIAAFTYPYAIVLPKSDMEAKGLMRISLYISGLIAIIITILLLIFNDPLVRLLKIQVIAPFLYLVPLVILFSSYLQVAQQWLIRTKQFAVTAKVSVINVIILNSAKVGIGLFNPAASILVVLSTFSNALQALLMTKGTKKAGQKNNRGNSYNFSKLIELAKKHRDFPLFRAPQTLINSVSQNLPVILLTGFFGPASAGFYSLAKTVLGMPTQLISQSVGDVFYPRIAEAANKGESLTKLITKATIGLAVVGIIPFGLIIFLGPWLFGFVFGEEWKVAGEYSRWLALWLFFGFINRPSTKAIPVMNLQGQFLLYEVISSFIRISALFFGFFVYNNETYAIMFFSLAGALLNLSLIIYTIRKSAVLNSKND